MNRNSRRRTNSWRCHLNNRLLASDITKSKRRAGQIISSHHRCLRVTPRPESTNSHCLSQAPTKQKAGTTTKARSKPKMRIILIFRRLKNRIISSLSETST